MQKVTAIRKQQWFTLEKEQEPELGCTDETVTDRQAKIKEN